MNVSAFSVAPGAIEQPLAGTLAFIQRHRHRRSARGRSRLVAAGRGSPRHGFADAAQLLDAHVVRAHAGSGADHAPCPRRRRQRAVRAGELVAIDGERFTCCRKARLLIALAWKSATDLDLHVIDPSGAEIWSDAPTSPSGGVLDLDSNAQCVIDGHDAENVRYANPPPGPLRGARRHLLAVRAAVGGLAARGHARRCLAGRGGRTERGRRHARESPARERT